MARELPEKLDVEILFRGGLPRSISVRDEKNKEIGYLSVEEEEALMIGADSVIIEAHTYKKVYDNAEAHNKIPSGARRNLKYSIEKDEIQSQAIHPITLH